MPVSRELDEKLQRRHLKGMEVWEREGGESTADTGFHSEKKVKSIPIAGMERLASMNSSNSGSSMNLNSKMNGHTPISTGLNPQVPASAPCLKTQMNNSNCPSHQGYNHSQQGGGTYPTPNGKQPMASNLFAQNLDYSLLAACMGGDANQISGDANQITGDACMGVDTGELVFDGQLRRLTPRCGGLPRRFSPSRLEQWKKGDSIINVDYLEHNYNAQSRPADAFCAEPDARYQAGERRKISLHDLFTDSNHPNTGLVRRRTKDSTRFQPTSGDDDTTGSSENNGASYGGQNAMCGASRAYNSNDLTHKAPSNAPSNGQHCTEGHLRTAPSSSTSKPIQYPVQHTPRQYAHLLGQPGMVGEPGKITLNSSPIGHSLPPRGSGGTTHGVIRMQLSTTENGVLPSPDSAKGIARMLTSPHLSSLPESSRFPCVEDRTSATSRYPNSGSKMIKSSNESGFLAGLGLGSGLTFESLAKSWFWGGEDNGSTSSASSSSGVSSSSGTNSSSSSRRNDRQEITDEQAEEVYVHREVQYYPPATPLLVDDSTPMSQRQGSQRHSHRNQHHQLLDPDDPEQLRLHRLSELSRNRAGSDGFYSDSSEAFELARMEAVREGREGHRMSQIERQRILQLSARSSRSVEFLDNEDLYYKEPKYRGCLNRMNACTIEDAMCPGGGFLN